ncbi:hypothetical protein SARC_02992 [Sphaeroforma arctica JP610]|uniref:Uncharacterized protein n=1 Tax=Sphaeroforma arctica JP610 TaxID=667725 RepID=A0A0L0G706_9EUKA|nr:hypothetical protein SARC_02992 [Sphaeroforma arctica JP610]KNC84817.1 hypothetical protein SARC_02992 [Sphaeroforma arctica JP610]|eukprot:XP_014158719.1 hypothetical protein SARC_02992 [Sphaeroforma arctica JP610]
MKNCDKSDHDECIAISGFMSELTLIRSHEGDKASEPELNKLLKTSEFPKWPVAKYVSMADCRDTIENRQIDQTKPDGSSGHLSDISKKGVHSEGRGGVYQEEEAHQEVEVHKEDRAEVVPWDRSLKHQHREDHDLAHAVVQSLNHMRSASAPTKRTIAA